MDEEHPLVKEARIKLEKSQLDADRAFMELVKTIIQSIIILIALAFGLYIVLRI